MISMKKSVSVVMIVLAVVMTLALGASLTLNIAAMGKADSLKNDVFALSEKVSSVSGDVVELKENLTAEVAPDEDVAAEDGVTIAGQYEIESTRAISDAYISGDRTGLDDRELETLDMASSVLDTIIEDGMTDYEKEMAVYVWMTHNLRNDGGILPVIPTSRTDSDNPYGVLKYRSAVCVGYATTFRLFMQMCDIECMVVHNTERYHTWDLVKLGDGWYHTDVYADVGSGSFSHFNMTDIMVEGQGWNTDFFPAADKYEYCYAYINSVECEDVFAFPSMLRECLDKKAPSLYLRLSVALYGGPEASLLSGMMSEIESRAATSAELSGVSFYYSFVPADVGFIFAVTVQYPDDGPIIPSGELTEEEYEKMYEAVDGSFGDLTWDDGGYTENGFGWDGDAE